MQKLYVQVDGAKRLVMAPQLAAAPEVDDSVYILPSGEVVRVASIGSTGAVDPLFQTIYTCTLSSRSIKWGSGASNHL